MKAVVKYSLDGVPIQEYKAITECAKLNNIDCSILAKHLKGKKGFVTVKGYIYRYKTDTFLTYTTKRWTYPISVKLTLDQVKDIREKLVQGIKPKDILKEYPNISKMTIINIKSGKTWKNI